MGGGPRPCWIGEPFKVKVEALSETSVVLSFDKDESDPMDIQVGHEYIVVFNPVPGDSGSAPEQS